MRMSALLAACLAAPLALAACQGSNDQSFSRRDNDYQMRNSLRGDTSRGDTFRGDTSRMTNDNWRPGRGDGSNSTTGGTTGTGSSGAGGTRMPGDMDTPRDDGR